MADRDDLEAARRQGFEEGTIAALAVIFGYGHSVCWADVVRAAGTQEILRRALTEEGDWQWAGFHKLAALELGSKELRKARRAVRGSGAPRPRLDAARTAGVDSVDGSRS